MSSASCWLSVILPTYNGARHLESTLDSLVAQEEMDFEVIVVDDGSTDATPEILRRYSKRLPMAVVESRHTGNWVANTNVGIRVAKGRYLGWLHQDDTWRRDRVSKLKRLTSRWPEALLVLHPVWFIDAGGRRIGPWRCPLPSRTRYLGAAELVGHLLVQNFVASTAPVFRAEAASKVGGLDEQLWYVADWDFWLKLARLGRSVYLPSPLSSVRLHRDSQTVTRASNTEDLQHQYAAVLSRYLPEWEQRHPNGRSVGRAARFSARLNMALLSHVAGRKVPWRGLLGDFVRLGPVGWHVFLRDSRIIERSISRIRAGLGRPPGR